MRRPGDEPPITAPDHVLRGGGGGAAGKGGCPSPSKSTRPSPLRSTSCRISSTSCAFSCSPSSAAMASRISALLISPSPFTSNYGARRLGGGHPPHRPHHPPSRAMVTPWSSGHHPLRACDDPHGHGSPVVMVSPRSVSPPCQWSPPWSPFPRGHSHPVVTVPSVPLGHPHGHCSPMGTVIPWSPRGHCPLRACGRPHGHRPHYGLSRVPVPSVPAVTLMAAVPPAPPWPRSPVAVAVPHGRRS